MSRKLPPLNALRTFEAAAANKLYVTHGAISQQICRCPEAAGFSTPCYHQTLIHRIFYLDIELGYDVNENL